MLDASCRKDYDRGVGKKKEGIEKMIVGILRQGYLEDQKGNQYPLTQDTIDWACLDSVEPNTVILFKKDRKKNPIASSMAITGHKVHTLEGLRVCEPLIRQRNGSR